MNKVTKRGLVLALASANAALLAANPVIQLDELVVSAAGVEQNIVDAPASITVISKEDLDKRPYMTVLDAVRDVEGVDIGESSDKSGQGGVSIRGMGADYTLILIDGRRQNNVGDIYPNAFGGNQFNHIPPKEMIERIEVIRGPASTLYGAEAMGGVINIITKKQQDRWSGSVTQSRTFESNPNFGADSTVEFALGGPIIADRLALLVRGSLYERRASNPEYAVAIDPNGEEHKRSLGFGGGGRTVDNQNTSLGARLDLKLADNQDLQFDIDRSKQVYDNRPLPGGGVSLGTLDSPASIMIADRTGRVRPRVGYTEDQEFTRDQWSLAHRGQWDWANSDLSLHYINSNNNGRSMPFTAEELAKLQQMYDDNGRTWVGIEDQVEAEFLPRDKRVLQTRQATVNAQFDSLVGNHLLVYGVNYLHAEMEDGVFGITKDGYQKGKSQPHQQASAFVEDNWELLNSLTLTLGARYDHHNIFGGNVSPRAYANWRVTPDWTIKGGVSTGYKAPRANDLYPGVTGFTGQGTNPMVGSPDLQPETSVSTEVAVYYSHPRGHNANITVFRNDFQDKIAGGDAIDCATTDDEELKFICDTWNLARLGQRTNIDSVTLQGVEVAGRVRLTESISFRANYTFTDSEQTSGQLEGRPYGRTARHMLNATADWRVNQRLNTFLAVENRSERFRSWDAEADKALYFEPYTTLHLGAGYQVSDNLNLTLRVNNLLDQDFTSYKTEFVEQDDGSYRPRYLDDYNLKYKSRNLWLSLTTSF